MAVPVISWLQRASYDEFAGENISIEFDAEKQTARIVNGDGSEIPTATPVSVLRISLFRYPVEQSRVSWRTMSLI